MIVGSYNFSSSGPICSILLKDDEVVDISVSVITKEEDKTKRNFVEKGTRATAQLVRRYGLHGELKFCFPSILKGDRQENLAYEMFKENSSVQCNRTPFSTVGGMARVSADNRPTYPCYGDFNEPLKVFTDASLKDDYGNPTIGVAILDNNWNMVSFFGEQLESFMPIDEAELESGFRGLERASELGATSVEWISDNQDAQAVFDEQKESDTCTDGLEDKASEKMASFEDFQYTDIQGTDNVLADAIAEDVYREEFLNGFEYTAYLE